MARLSQGLISRLASPALSEDLSRIGRTLGAGGMLFNQAREEADFKRGSENLDMSKPEDLLKLAKLYQARGNFKEATVYAGEASRLAQEAQQKEKRSNLAASMSERFGKVGITVSADDILAGDIGNYQKQLIELEAKQVEQISPKKGRLVRLEQVGITDPTQLDLTKEDVFGMKKEGFDSLIKSLQTEQIAFTDKENNQVFRTVRKESGLVKNPLFGTGKEGEKEWVEPSSLGLTPAITRTQNEELNDNEQVNELLAEMAFTDYAELHAAAKTGAKTIESGVRALNLIDQAFIGPGATTKLTLGKAAVFLSDTLGIPVPEEIKGNVEATEAFIINRLEEMAVFIQKLGAGTGLSDNDARIAIQAVGGDIGLTAGALKTVIGQYIVSAQYAKTQFNKATNILNENRDNLTDEALIEILTLQTEVANSGMSGAERLEAFLKTGDLQP